MTSNYNKAAIMTKAHSLRKNYGMTKSESLTKAWALAKIEALDGRLWELDLIDVPNQEVRALMNSLRREREMLVERTYPMKEIEITNTYCGMVETFTREVRDFHAYDAA